MAVSSTAPVGRRPRPLSEWITLAILGVLLLFQLVYLGLGLTARNLVIAAAVYQLDVYVDAEYDDWVRANTLQETWFAFQDMAPEFRQHRPEVDVEPRRISVTVLIKNGVDVRARFESLGQGLNELVRQKWERAPGASVVRLADVKVTTYPWFKPLDLVSLMVLLAAVAAWVFLS
jgi:hypothetical protein